MELFDDYLSLYTLVSCVVTVRDMVYRCFFVDLIFGGHPMAENIHNSEGSSGQGTGNLAVAQRLARLATMPVDTTKLDRALRAQISLPKRNVGTWRIAVSGLVAAAVILAALLIPLTVPHSSRASVSDLSQIYNRMLVSPLAGGITNAQKNTLQLMCPPTTGHLASCCMQTLHHHRVACMLVKRGKQTVGVVVVPAGSLEYPQGIHRRYEGGSFIVRKTGKLNIVIRSGRRHWICVMGPQRVSELMLIASQIHSSGQ